MSSPFGETPEEVITQIQHVLLSLIEGMRGVAGLLTQLTECPWCSADPVTPPTLIAHDDECPAGNLIDCMLPSPPE